MKLFLDTANAEIVKQAYETGLIDGITTNPSIIAKSGRSFEEAISSLVKTFPKHISVEVLADNADDMVEEALGYSKLGSQIAIKVPMTREGLKAVPRLEESGIRVNVTMVFSATQALLAMKSGASFVSIVLGRLDAIASGSAQLINDTMAVKSNFGFKSEIIAGSIKTQNHLLDCMRAGLDIATIPPELFDLMFKHPLTDSGISGFKADWERLKMSLESHMG